MATRSRIGILNADNTVTSVYVHWDGSPDTRMPSLAKYKTAAAVRNLIRRGDMSSISTDLGWDRNERPEGPLYYSERGERTPAITNCSPAAYKRTAVNFDAEYLYIFVPRGRAVPAGFLPWYKIPPCGWYYCSVSSY